MIPGASAKSLHDPYGIAAPPAGIAIGGGLVWIATAFGDHALEPFDPKTNQPHTAHTTNPVPLILFDPDDCYGKLRDGGALENVAPTILQILGIEKPKEMTAESLLTT